MHSSWNHVSSAPAIAKLAHCSSWLPSTAPAPCSPLPSDVIPANAQLHSSAQLILQFCATGKGGFARNLLPHEIVDQVLTVQEEFGQVRSCFLSLAAAGESRVACFAREKQEQHALRRQQWDKATHSVVVGTVAEAYMVAHVPPPFVSRFPCPMRSACPTLCSWARVTHVAVAPHLSFPAPPNPHVQRVSNIVFMGMGEPLLNLPSVLRAHEILNKDIGIGAHLLGHCCVGS